MIAWHAWQSCYNQNIKRSIFSMDGGILQHGATTIEPQGQKASGSSRQNFEILLHTRALAPEHTEILRSGGSRLVPKDYEKSGYYFLFQSYL